MKLNRMKKDKDSWRPLLTLLVKLMKTSSTCSISRILTKRRKALILKKRFMSSNVLPLLLSTCNLQGAKRE
jgi:hypothetical protein